MKEIFFAATRSGDLPRVRALLAEEPTLARAVEPQSGRTALHLALHAEMPELVELLLAAGADIDGRSAEGRSPLHDSIEYGHRSMEKLLVEEGAEIDICAAAILGMQDHVREHLDRDPQLANERSTNLSPLGWASYGNKPDVARVLIQHGARMDDGELFCAASCGHIAVAQALLEHGVDPNAIDPRTGGTTLHTAVRMRYTSDSSGFVVMLLASGADPSIPTREGKTALQLAEELGRRQEEDGPGEQEFPRNYEKVAKVLRDAMRQP